MNAVRSVKHLMAPYEFTIECVTCFSTMERVKGKPGVTYDPLKSHKYRCPDCRAEFYTTKLYPTIEFRRVVVEQEVERSER